MSEILKSNTFYCAFVDISMIFMFHLHRRQALCLSELFKFIQTILTSDLRSNVIAQLMLVLEWTNVGNENNKIESPSPTQTELIEFAFDREYCIEYSNWILNGCFRFIPMIVATTTTQKGSNCNIWIFRFFFVSLLGDGPVNYPPINHFTRNMLSMHKRNCRQISFQICICKCQQSRRGRATLLELRWHRNVTPQNNFKRANANCREYNFQFMLNSINTWRAKCVNCVRCSRIATHQQCSMFQYKWASSTCFVSL